MPEGFLQCRDGRTAFVCAILSFSLGGGRKMGVPPATEVMVRESTAYLVAACTLASGKARGLQLIRRMSHQHGP